MARKLAESFTNVVQGLQVVAEDARAGAVTPTFVGRRELRGPGPQRVAQGQLELKVRIGMADAP